MTCVLPPEPDDLQLLAFLDDEPAPGVQEHLAGCEYCRARAEALDALQARLVDRLHRSPCPEPLQLGEHQLGILDSARAALIEEHLTICPACRAEAAQLLSYLADLASEVEPMAPLEAAQRMRAPVPGERVRVLVARLAGGAARLTGSWGLEPALAPVGVRGAEAGPAVYSAGEFQVVLAVRTDAVSADRWVVQGMILGLPAEGSVARLFATGRQVAEDEIDDLGDFLFEGLLAGEYDLIIAGEELELHVPGVVVS